MLPDFLLQYTFRSEFTNRRTRIILPGTSELRASMDRTVVLLLFVTSISSLSVVIPSGSDTQAGKSAMREECPHPNTVIDEALLNVQDGDGLYITFQQISYTNLSLTVADRQNLSVTLEGGATFYNSSLLFQSLGGVRLSGKFCILS